MFDFNTETGRIRAYGIIADEDYEPGISAVDFVKALDAMGGQDIELHIKSDGGDVDEGMSIYNQLMNYPGSTTVHIDANAYSIATVIAMAGRHITANANANLMIHAPWCIAMGNSAEFRSVAEVLDQREGQIAQIYANRAGGNRADWQALMSKDTYFTADQAYAKGLVDQVVGVAQEAAAGVQNMAPAPGLAKWQAWKKAAAIRQKLWIR